MFVLFPPKNSVVPAFHLLLQKMSFVHSSQRGSHIVTFHLLVQVSLEDFQQLTPYLHHRQDKRDKMTRSAQEGWRKRHTSLPPIENKPSPASSEPWSPL